MGKSAAQPLDGFRAFVRRTMRQWDVPGMGVAVVRGGRTIFAEGFGLADVGRKIPATAETMFPIGSITKSFTATALGILVDEGKLDWDRPVCKYMKDFRLYDRLAGERVTPRDLLCHRTGLPRHDNAWYGLDLTRKQLFQKLRHLRPSRDFRERWQYQNMMFMVAGLLVEDCSGQTWEQFVAERIFGPLGMDQACFSSAKDAAGADFARPYKRKRGRRCRTGFDSRSMIRAAGTIAASAASMARWLRLHLSDGEIDGVGILKPRTLDEIHTPQIFTREPVRWDELGRISYALGWQVQSYRGQPTLWHGGLVNGYQAHIGLLPGVGGAVALSNLMGHAAPNVVVKSAFDRLLGLRPLPWSARYRKFMDSEAAKAAKAAARQKRAAAAKKAKPRRPRALKHYVGEYSNGGYGVMKIQLVGRKLQAVWSGITHELRHDHGDVFVMLRPVWEAKDMLTFDADDRGRIVRLSVPFESAAKPIVFRRRKD